ncbi:MAG: OmpA family protein [Pseudomonadota bacterium]
MRKVSLQRGFVLLAGLALVGCAPGGTGTPGAATGTGAATGAVIGGIIGNVTAPSGNRTENTAIGAALGAALGGGIGYAVDRQQQDFEQQLAAERARNEVQIRQLRNDVLMVTLASDVQFATGSAAIQPGVRGTLQRIADVLARYPGSQVTIIGHTDSTGTPAFNQQLSEERANAVRLELIGYGVPASTLFALGRGENEPVADNQSASGRAANRRVELIVSQAA